MREIRKDTYDLHVQVAPDAVTRKGDDRAQLVRMKPSTILINTARRRKNP